VSSKQHLQKWRFFEQPLFSTEEKQVPRLEKLSQANDFSSLGMTIVEMAEPEKISMLIAHRRAFIGIT
jgi:hypothetical protein